ncbi:tetratricopeptide repeat protein [Ekhidna sp.]
MKKLISIFLIGMTVSVTAQTSQETQYAAYLKASKTMWERSISIAEKESGDNSLDKAIAMYGLLSNTMATEDEDTFDEYIDPAVDLLKEIMDKSPDNGEARAVLSSIYGLVMAYSPMKGVLYGMKSSSLMDEALRLEPESALVQKLHGGSKLYTPEMFGGDPDKAVIAFEKSIELFEREGVSERWLYADTFMGLAMAYNKVGKKDEAKKTLEKAIAMEPEFYWAKSVLAELEKS